MLSTARVAQLGVVAVVAVLVLTLGVLASRAAERQLFSAPAAPAFSLKDIDGQTVSFASLKGKVTVLVFSSVRCPVSNSYTGRINRLVERFESNPNVRVLLVETAGDGAMPSLAELKIQRHVTDQKCPTLLDYGAKLAQSYGVEQTPTVCIVDEQGGLRYRGPFDDHRDEAKVHVAHCLDTVNALLSGRPTRATFAKPAGCPIRYVSQFATATPR